MADADRRKAAQPAHSSNSLGFGHFGTATYNQEASQWSFLREAPGDNIEVKDKQIEQPSFRLIKVSAHDSGDIEKSKASADGPNRVTTNGFLKALPEAASLVCGHENDFMLHPPLDDRQITDSSLLTFGSALVLGGGDTQSGFQTAPVTLRVYAGQLDTLVATLVNSETIPLEMDSVQQVQLPCISEDESITWCSKRGSIMQIRTSATSSSKGATWLAVRQTTATTIFQLLQHRTMTRSSNKSLLELSLLVELPVSRTGGLQHVDVMFHPQDPHKFAVVDLAGHWSIWTITGTRSRSARILYHAQLTSGGLCISRPGKSVLQDDWHRVVWLSNDHQNVNFLLVASRQSLFLFDIKGSMLSQQDACIGTQGRSWILDVLVAPLATFDFLVITTSHVFWMSVATLAEDTHNHAQLDKVSVIACWKHFYNYAHMEQNLNAVWFSRAVWLFAASADNQVITAYRCTRSGNAETGGYHVSDPLKLDVPLSQNNGMRCLNVQVVEPGLYHSGEQSKSNSQLLFFKAFYQESSGNMQELLCLLTDPNTGLPLDTVPLPKKHSSQHKSATYVSQIDSDDDLEDFIVSDNESDLDQDFNIERVAQSTSQSSEMATNALTKTNQSRVCNLQKTYDEMTSHIHLSKTKDKSVRNSIVQSIQDSMGDHSIIQTISELISDAGSDEFHVAEIENDSQVLERWVQSLSEVDSEVKPEHLTSSRVWKDQSLINIYEELVDKWMSPLSKEVSNRFRVQRERLLRQVALDIYLSTVLLRSSIVTPSQNTQKSSDQSDPTMSSLPLRMDQLEINSIPPSPSPTSTQNFSPPSAPPSLLARYTSFNPPKVTNTKTTATITNILSHLPLSPTTPPSTYNHTTTELALSLASNNLTTDETTNSHSRRKAEKRARARKKQLEKQAQLQKAALDQINTLPSILSSSQLPIREVQSSQAGFVGVGSSQVTAGGSSGVGNGNVPLVSMTQPERGVFGRREVKKGKGKGGRMKGF